MPLTDIANYDKVLRKLEAEQTKYDKLTWRIPDDKGEIGFIVLRPMCGPSGKVSKIQAESTIKQLGFHDLKQGDQAQQVVRLFSCTMTRSEYLTVAKRSP